jgi:hypothetical protein
MGVKMAVNSFLIEDDEKSYEFFIHDAFVSITRAWSCIDCTHPETLATFDSLMKEAEERSVSFFAVAAERNTFLTTPVAALCVGNALFNWKVAAPNFSSFQESVGLLWKVDDAPDSILLDNVLEVLDTLATPPPS